MKRPPAVILVALLAASCGGQGSRARGVVVDVVGDLESVTSFEILTPDGERLVFRPAPGLTAFDDGPPLSHLGEHLRAGDPIRVTYEESGGELIAETVEDSG